MMKSRRRCDEYFKFPNSYVRQTFEKFQKNKCEALNKLIHRVNICFMIELFVQVDYSHQSNFSGETFQNSWLCLIIQSIILSRILCLLQRRWIALFRARWEFFWSNKVWLQWTQMWKKSFFCQFLCHSTKINFVILECCDSTIAVITIDGDCFCHHYSARKLSGDVHKWISFFVIRSKRRSSFEKFKPRTPDVPLASFKRNPLDFRHSHIFIGIIEHFYKFMIIFN